MLSQASNAYRAELLSKEIYWAVFSQELSDCIAQLSFSSGMSYFCHTWENLMEVSQAEVKDVRSALRTLV